MFARAATPGRPEPMAHAELAFADVQPGLSLQAIDMRADRAQADIAILPRSLSLSLLLQGHVKVGVQRDVCPIGGSQAQMAVFHASQDTEISRELEAGVRLRHLSILATPDWLERSGLADYREAVAVLSGRHRNAMTSLTVCDRTVALAEQLLRDSKLESALAKLRRESHVLEIVAQTLGALDERQRVGSLTSRQLRRLYQVRERLQTAAEGPLSVAALALDHGMSVDTLQRQFRSAFGVTVFAYLQEYRLQQARRKLEGGAPVSSVAYAAGYSSPANFSTAFKRRFGVSPKQVTITL